VLWGLCKCYGDSETKEKDTKANASSCSWVDGVSDGDTEDERQQVDSSLDKVGSPTEKANDVFVTIHHSGSDEFTHDHLDKGEVVEPCVEAVQQVVAEFRAEYQGYQE
jgi:hypothetical protein